jgi:hypothetical protein
MAFPFNLHAVEWSAHQDAFGKAADEIPEWLASLADDQPGVREEAAAELQERFAVHATLAPVCPHAVEPLLKLVESEAAKGRALAAMLLAHLAHGAKLFPSTHGRAVLDAIEDERATLELVSTRHAASTPLGAAVRALTAVLTSGEPVPASLQAQLDAVEALVNEADAKDEAPPPTREELTQWLERVKEGKGQAVPLAQRALAVDPRAALAILETDPKPTSVTGMQRVNRVVIKALCLDALGEPARAAAGPWSLTDQSLLLAAAERHAPKAPSVARQLLDLVKDPSHLVHRRAIEVRVAHALGKVDAAWERAEALANEWLQPAKTGGVNQSLDKTQLLDLLGLFGGRAAQRREQISAAPMPEIALPEGDVL